MSRPGTLLPYADYFMKVKSHLKVQPIMFSFSQLLLHSVGFRVQEEVIQKIMIFCGNGVWKSINEIIPHQSLTTSPKQMQAEEKHSALEEFLV